MEIVIAGAIGAYCTYIYVTTSAKKQKNTQENGSHQQIVKYVKPARNNMALIANTDNNSVITLPYHQHIQENDTKIYKKNPLALEWTNNPVQMSPKTKSNYSAETDYSMREIDSMLNDFITDNS